MSCVLAKSNEAFFHLELPISLFVTDMFERKLLEVARGKPTECMFHVPCWGDTFATVVFTKEDILRLNDEDIDGMELAKACADALSFDKWGSCYFVVGHRKITLTITEYRRNLGDGPTIIFDPAKENLEEETPLHRTIRMEVAVLAFAVA